MASADSRDGRKKAVGRRTRSVRSRPAARGVTTSKEVAHLAGVSRSAVSRAFTPDASVSDLTRRKVMAAAAKLGYQPNIIARSLITRHSGLIGLIMGEWENPFYATVLRGFSEKLQLRDYQLMLLTRAADGSVDGAVQRLLQYRADGIVLVSCAPSAPVAQACVRSGTRLVVVNRGLDPLPAVNVLSDNAGIGHDVAQLLLRAGYRRLALVRGDPSFAIGIARTKAFCAAVAAVAKARIVLDTTGVMGYAAGRHFVAEAMRQRLAPDAIFCSSDLTAFGVLDGARIDLGLAVPEALAVVGLGDTPAASWAPYDLTTVRLPLDGLIDASIEALLTDSPPDPDDPILIRAGIVLRSTVRSSGAPPV